MADTSKHQLNSDEFSLTERLKELHSSILERSPGVRRIICTLYDSETDLLKTFSSSAHTEHNVEHHEFSLGQSKKLVALKKSGACEVINRSESGLTDSNSIDQSNYCSSFVIPMMSANQFMGFIFIDSEVEDYFGDQIQRDLVLFTKLITLTIISEMPTVLSLIDRKKSVSHFAHLRDFETGRHLNRMALLSRMIAKSIADECELTDEFIEQLYLFSPLHDIGKIGIPGQILFKPDKLTEQEFEVMKGHVAKGVEIISEVLDDYHLSDHKDSQVMLNIVSCHHEYLNGSGYPKGLTGDEIPIEARIVTVADIFDALTSTRPYKEAMSIDKSIKGLEALVEIGRLDPLCVSALTDNLAQATEIVTQYRDR